MRRTLGNGSFARDVYQSIERVAAVRAAAGEHQEVRHSQGINVGGRSGIDSLEQLRRHEMRRPAQAIGQICFPLADDALRQAEVSQLRHALQRHQHVIGLEVAVDDSRGGLRRGRRRFVPSGPWPVAAPIAVRLR